MLTGGVFTPEELPPAEQAACYHGFCVHLQIIQWKMLDETQLLKLTEWGWKKDNGYLVPIPTDKDVASAYILKVIKCRCKLTSKNQFGSNLCSCIKNGLKCMSANAECHGENCNSKKVSNLSILFGNSMDSVPYYI